MKLENSLSCSHRVAAIDSMAFCSAIALATVIRRIGSCMELCRKRILLKAMIDTHQNGSPSVVLALALLLSACAGDSEPSLSATTISGDRNFLFDYPAFVEGCAVNVVVEIPAGTNEKWETSKDGESIDWELVNGQRRIVQYAPYPGNYGLVPRTLLPEESGGDGDPLDVLVLSTSVPRGTVMPAVPVAVLGLNDSNEQDDKIIAVPFHGPLSEVTGLDHLNEQYPGVTQLVETWFSGYKAGETVSTGYRDKAVACELINEASAAFEAAHDTTSN